MPDPQDQPLLRLGPFKGFRGNNRDAGPYQDPQTAVFCSNADTTRIGQGLSNYHGRALFINFPGIGNLQIVTRYDVAPSRPYYIVQGTGTSYYDLNNELITSLSGVNTYTQAVQANGSVFLNNGQQIYVTPDPSYPGTPQQQLAVCSWQYPAPSTAYSTDYGTPDPTHPALAPGQYYYAFVQVIQVPTINGIVNQTTAPVGNTLPFPYTRDILIAPPHPAHYIILQGTFSGLTADGLNYTTTIYRQSTNVPVWFELATDVMGTTYFDTATDLSIQGNPELNPANDQPPVSDGTMWPIEEYQDRMWVLAVVNNASTNNVPQTQLWYSNEGQPWSFDSVNQVLLVGDENTTPASDSNGTLPYGQQPAQLAKLGSLLLVFTNISTWVMQGSDATSYLAIPFLPDIGMIAPLSGAHGTAMYFWLSAEGVYSFDGASLQYISDDIHNELQAIQPNLWLTAAGAYKNLKYLLSFPEAGITFSYYIPSKTWTTLPYATPSFAVATGVGDNPIGLSDSINQLIAVDGTQLDAWFAGKENDLGLGTTVTWTGPQSDSGIPFAQKDFRYLGVNAPIQTGEVTVTLQVEPGTGIAAVSQTFDLSQGQSTKQFPIPQGACIGYTAQLSVTFTTPVGATKPITIWSVFAGGQIKRSWTQQN
jgi:hypothetical protein